MGDTAWAQNASPLFFKLFLRTLQSTTSSMVANLICGPLPVTSRVSISNCLRGAALENVAKLIRAKCAVSRQVLTRFDGPFLPRTATGARRACADVNLNSPGCHPCESALYRRRYGPTHFATMEKNAHNASPARKRCEHRRREKLLGRRAAALAWYLGADCRINPRLISHVIY